MGCALPVQVRTAVVGLFLCSILSAVSADAGQAVNQPPAVNAGTDKTVSFPTPVVLSGVVTDDGLPGSGITASWTSVSGPGTVTFAVPTAASTTANFSAAGQYVLQLTASDGDLSASDTVTVTVNAGSGLNTAIDLAGLDSYVALGPAPSLALATFTVELWLKREGEGRTATTGSGGITAVPLVAKGRHESGDRTSTDVNYFFGINAAGKLVADFEEGSNGSVPGLNHPVTGATTLALDTWYHAAATYDGTTWRLYLNGVQDAELVVGQPARSDNIQHAGIGSALSSFGTPGGFFDGQIDEVRIWGVARTASQIQDGMSQVIPSAPDLRGRWGFDEGTGTQVWDSSENHITGTVIDIFYSWAPGAPFRPNQVPSTPVLISPTNGDTNAPTSPTLTVSVADGDNDPMNVSFFGGRVPASGTPDFTIVAIPDTQHYVDDPARAATFTAQTQWIAANKLDKNIVFVTHLGDVVQNKDLLALEWTRADESLRVLDAANMTWGLSPGNHDMSSGGVANYYDLYFPVSRFDGYPWYGGYLGKDPVNDPVNRQNKNSYQLFSVGGLDFIVVHLEYDIPGYSLAWADRILKQYPNRRAIVSTHLYLNADGVRPPSVLNRANGTSAENVWRQLISTNCNVFMVLNGHYDGESNRTDRNICGQPVHQLQADYQERANGGNGFLRYMDFKPAENKVYVFTFSPTLNGGAGMFETDADSQFVLTYNMQGPVYAPIATSPGVTSGAEATATWPDLAGGKEYEWYVRMDDGIVTATGPTWRFTTSSANRAPVAHAQNAATLQDTPRAITLTGSDPDDDALTFRVVTGPSHGTLSGTEPGLTYTPASGYTGPDSFTFVANDGELESSPALVSISVAASNVTLSVDIVGSGGGTIESNPSGIMCPGSCVGSFAPGTDVTLNRTVNAGWAFTGWSGACTGTGPCVVTMTGNLSVTATFAVSGSDLVVSALSNPPAIAAPGTTFVATDTVLNDGALTAGASTTRFYLSLDGLLDAGDIMFTASRTVPGLTGGTSSSGSTTLLIPATAPLGIYRVLACADDHALVTELDETNNCLASSSTVNVTQPDLVVTSVTSPPAEAVPGGRFTITDAVQNQGLLSGGASQTYYYLSLDTVFGGDVLMAGARSVAALAPDAVASGNRTVTVPTSTPLGTYYLLACADGGLAVAEASEGNNCLPAQTRVVIGWPDLVTTNISNPPLVALLGGKITASHTVSNEGQITALASSSQYYLSSDRVRDAADLQLTGALAITSLAPGTALTAERAVTVPTTVPMGPYYLIACADNAQRVAESNELNNCLASTSLVEVTLPDLVEIALSEPPATAAPGGAFTVADTVQNQGNIEVASTSTAYYLSVDVFGDTSDILLTGARSVPLLGAGAASSGSRSVTIPAATPPGVYYLLACADSQVRRLESNEDNNCRASTTTVQVGQ